jgi:hypothetical protein
MAFYIQSLDSKKYLDVKDNNESAGAEVIIYDFHGGKNQQWKYKDGMIVSKLNGCVSTFIHSHSCPRFNYSYNGQIYEAQSMIQIITERTIYFKYVIMLPVDTLIQWFSAS